MVSTIKRPFIFKEGRFGLTEVSYTNVKSFASRGSKERVSISNTNNTIWFHITYKDNIVGVCALYLAKNKCRIKGDWIIPEYRGKGLGEFITLQAS